MKPLDKLTVTVWEMALVRTFIYSLVVTGGALKIALVAKPWVERTGNDQFILVLELLGVQCGVVLAFIDQTIAKLQADGGTAVIDAPLQPHPMNERQQL